MDLDALLEDFTGLTTVEAEQRGRDLYSELYINQGRRGCHQCHDADSVVFWEDRFEHAFFTSKDRARHPYDKSKLALDRLERIRWIGEVISGRVPGTECWHVPSESHRPFPPMRLYIVWDKHYVVWLEPKKGKYGEWKFSSAYSPSPKDIRRYCQGGRKVWCYEKNTPRD